MHCLRLHTCGGELMLTLALALAAVPTGPAWGAPATTGSLVAVTVAAQIAVTATSRPVATSQPSTATYSSKPKSPDQLCQTGCAVSKRPQGPLPLTRYREMLTRYARVPAGSENKALEMLLYFANQSRQHLKKHGVAGLPPAHKRQFLKELAKTHALIWVRVIDDKGVVRVKMGPKRVEVGHHFHLHADQTVSIQKPDFGGRVERVGLRHLWVRI